MKLVSLSSILLSVSCLLGAAALASTTTDGIPTIVEMDQDYRVYYSDGTGSPIISKVVEVMLKDAVSDEYQNVVIRRVAKNLLDLPTTSLYSVDLKVTGLVEKCDMPAFNQYEQTNVAAISEFRKSLNNYELMEAWSKYRNRPRITEQMQNEIEAEFLQCGVDLEGKKGCWIHVSVDRLTGDEFEKTYTALLTAKSCPVLKTVTDRSEIKVNFRKATPTAIEIFE